MYIKFSVRLLNTKNIIEYTQTFNVYSQSTIFKYLLKIKKLTALTFQHNMPRMCLLRLGNKIIKRAHTHKHTQESLSPVSMGYCGMDDN